MALNTPLDPANLLLFAQVVDTGSFSGAAARAQLPKSTVSRRIAALERDLGERLLQRTTRKLSLTDFGSQLLVHARQVAAEVEAAASLALHRQAQPSGRLRVSLPSDPLGIDLARFSTEFLHKHPAITLELDLSARRVDLVGESFDLALRMGELPDDATLVARRMFEHTWGLYAAPIYLAMRGTPREPADLLQHDGLGLRSRAGEPIPWLLRRGDERWEGLPKLRAWANSPGLVARMALEGAGISSIPDWTACEHIRMGHLVRVLPDWYLPSSVGWAVMPGRRLMPAKTRVFLEMFEAALARDLLPELERIPRVDGAPAPTLPAAR